jgi:hypothetical protein
MRPEAKVIRRVPVAVCLGLLVWLALAGRAAGADDHAPRIPVSGPTIASFAPPGYQIEQTEELDLDGDGLRDAALLVVPACEGVGELRAQDECRSEGRMLIIVFRQAKGGYRLSIAKPIESTVGPHGDSFGGMKVRGRALTFKGASSSCAGQVGESSTLLFRYQNGDWFLIGQTDSTWRLSTECGGGPIGRGLCPGLQLRAGEACVQLDRSYNLLTRMEESKWSIQREEGDAQGEEREVVVQRKLPKVPPSRLTDYRLGF